MTLRAKEFDSKSEQGYKKNFFSESSAKIMSTSHPQEFKKKEQKDPMLALKNSWQDKLKKIYIESITDFSDNSDDKATIVVAVSDFCNIDFGDNHGTVHNSLKPYRWDIQPYTAMIFFFNWIVRQSKVRIFYNVPKFGNEQDVSITLSKTSFQRFKNSEFVSFNKEPKGMIEPKGLNEEDSDIRSIGSENSWAKKVKNSQVKDSPVKDSPVKDSPVKESKGTICGIAEFLD